MYNVLTSFRHPPQNTTLNVTLVPFNDNGPIISLGATEVNYIDSSPPVQVFPNLTISDFDNSICNPQLLVAAQVVVETNGADTNDENLEVISCTQHLISNPTTIHSF